MKNQNIVLRVLRGLLRWIDRFRRVLHLLFMLFVLSLVATLLAPQQPVVPAAAALVLARTRLSCDGLNQLLTHVALMGRRGDRRHWIIGHRRNLIQIASCNAMEIDTAVIAGVSHCGVR